MHTRQHLRSSLRAGRAARQLGDPSSGAAGLAAAAPSLPLPPAPEPGRGLVLSYAALPGEPDPAALNGALAARGFAIALPVVAGPGRLDWALDTGRRRPARVGGPVPDSPPATLAALTAAAGRVALALVPCLAVGPNGARLGQGGGYYDRAFGPRGLLPAPGFALVGVCFDEEYPVAVPAAEHDLSVAAVLGPGGLRAVPPAG